MSCPKCQTDVASAKNTVKCVECGSAYHVTCCRTRSGAKLSAKAMAAWKCDECAQDTASVRSEPEDPKLAEILFSIQRDIAANQETNKQGFSAINTQLANMQETLSTVHKQLAAVEAENAAIKAECEVLRAENKALNQRVNSLVTEVEDMQQYSRNRNIEIFGVPVTKNENIYEILSSVANALRINFSRQDISIAHRLSAPRGKTPSIVAQFISRSTRAEWIAAAKQRKIQTTDLVATSTPSPVFLADHLTLQNKCLLGHARSLVRDKHLAFAWSKEGRIFVRRTRDSSARRVQSIGEVDFVAASGRGGGCGDNLEARRTATNTCSSTK